MAYGIELISESGNKFIIPDSNPYTFYAKYTATCGPSNPRVTHNTGISSSAKIMVFYRVVSGEYFFTQYFGHYKSGNTWHITFLEQVYGSSFEAYVFADAEYKDVSGGASYGLQVFDGTGRLIYGNDSRPLKMTMQAVGNPDTTYRVELGYPTACAPTCLRLYGGAEGNAAVGYGYKNGISLTTVGLIGGVSQSSSNFPLIVPCININDYQ